MSKSTVFRCKNVDASFAKHSARMRQIAVENNMRFDSDDDGGVLFHAVATSPTSLYPEIGACINMVPRVWYTSYGTIFENVFLPKVAS